MINRTIAPIREVRGFRGERPRSGGGYGDYRNRKERAASCCAGFDHTGRSGRRKPGGRAGCESAECDGDVRPGEPVVVPAGSGKPADGGPGGESENGRGGL